MTCGPNMCVRRELWDQLVASRDAARADVERLTRERDDAVESRTRIAASWTAEREALVAEAYRNYDAATERAERAEAERDSLIALIEGVFYALNQKAPRTPGRNMAAMVETIRGQIDDLRYIVDQKTRAELAEQSRDEAFKLAGIVGMLADATSDETKAVLLTRESFLKLIGSGGP